MKRRITTIRIAWTGLVVTSLLAAVAGTGCVSSSNNPQPTADSGVAGFDGSTSHDAGGISSDASTGTDGNVVDAPQGDCPSGWVTSGGVCVLNLLGAWSMSTDANSDGPDTVATLGANTATSVSVDQSHTGTDNADCGCNAQHLDIPLGKSFDCASSTLAFDYATTVQYGALNTPAVDIRFCTGPCPSVDGGAGGPYFYTGPQFVGSIAAPIQSACGYEWENDAGTASLNYFPQSAAIQTGTNTIPLGSYVAPAAADDCTGSFDTIDVHIQVYNCSAAQTGTSTISNLRVY